MVQYFQPRRSFLLPYGRAPVPWTGVVGYGTLRKVTGFPDMYSFVNSTSIQRMKSKSRSVGTGDVVHA